MVHQARTHPSSRIHTPVTLHSKCKPRCIPSIPKRITSAVGKMPVCLLSSSVKPKALLNLPTHFIYIRNIRMRDYSAASVSSFA